MSPQVIAHYRITAKLGQGGMGEVYRATDTKLNREVAIKVIPEAFAQDADRMARFTREAQVLASLNHPNIAAIYGVEERALVMELVEGETLAGPLPLDTALNYAHQITGALEAAHEKGIVHRDLKPANIMITPAGVVKVLDFGLAAVGQGSGPGSSDPANSPTLTIGATQAGVILGTAAYMAPEQARGQTVDKRADIWAFGVVLFEMFTGKRLFDGETVSDTLAAVLTREIDWALLPKDTPVNVHALLRRCLERDRKLRLRDLGDAWNVPDVPVARSNSASTWIALTAAMALIAVLALWAPWRKPVDAPLLQFDLDVGGDDIPQLAVSPDGKLLVMAAKAGLTVRRLEQRTNTVLAGTDGAEFPFFSPDSQWIAFFAAGKLQRIAVEGGAPIVICDGVGRGGSWGDGGTIVATLGPTGGLSRIPVSGGAPQPLTDLSGEVEGVASHRWPQVLPNGKGVLFTAFSTGGQASLRALPPDGGNAKTLVSNSTYGRYVASGHLLYYQQGDLFAAPMDLRRLELTGPAKPLANEIAYRSDIGLPILDVSSSGTLVYRQGRESRVVSWLYAAGNTEPLMRTPGIYSTPRLSPEGKRLAVAIGTDSKRNLVVYDISRDIMTRLTSSAEGALYPVWTPDGEFLAFASGDTVVWTRADGSGGLERLGAGVRGAFPWSFSADGDWLAYHQQGDLWIAPAERRQSALRLGPPKRLLEQPGSQLQPAPSPDGRWVAYCSYESGRPEIYVIPFNGAGPPRAGKWQVSNDGGVHPIWARDGQELFYRSPDRRIMAVRYRTKDNTFVVEKPRVWADKQLADSGVYPTFDIAADGRRAAVILDAPLAEKRQNPLRVMINLDSELRRRGAVK